MKKKSQYIIYVPSLLLIFSIVFILFQNTQIEILEQRLISKKDKIEQLSELNELIS
ncbi:hypothetical protein [Vagococcus silagei]